MSRLPWPRAALVRARRGRLQDLQEQAYLLKEQEAGSEARKARMESELGDLADKVCPSRLCLYAACCW